MKRNKRQTIINEKKKKSRTTTVKKKDTVGVSHRETSNSIFNLIKLITLVGEVPHYSLIRSVTKHIIALASRLQHFM